MAGARHPFDDYKHRRAFGEQLRLLRLARHLTQDQLAGAAHMDRSYLADIERGQGNPTLDMMARLAEALGVDIGKFFPWNVTRFFDDDATQ